MQKKSEYRAVVELQKECERLRHTIQILEQFRERAFAAEASNAKWEQRFDGLMKLAAKVTEH